MIAEPGALPGERIAIADIFARRRLQVLRLVIPGLLALVILELPLTMFTWNGQTALLLGLPLATLALAALSMVLRRPEVATGAIIIGTLASVGTLVFTHGPSTGQLATQTFALLFLLDVPIVLAGVLAGPLAVLGTVVGAFGISLVVAGTSHLAPDLQAVVVQHNAVYLLVLPQLSQIGIGFLMFASTFGVGRMQGELADLRIAYAREKDLEQLREQFIANVNHELRSPIMALQGYIGLAKELVERSQADAAGEMLTKGAEVADHLADLVRSILAVRRLREAELAPKLEAVELAPTLQDVLHTVAMMFDAQGPVGDARFRLLVADDLIVSANTERLQEVFSNLLTNAVKYSPPGTPIIIAAQAATANQRRQLGMTDPMILISVRDYGAGIPPEQTLHLFEPFTRLERDEQSTVVGTGLGLAICKAHVLAMKGQIWVESTGIAGEGSTFVVALPAATPGAA